jgi:hypothetical protein
MQDGLFVLKLSLCNGLRLICLVQSFFGIGYLHLDSEWRMLYAAAKIDFNAS